MYGRVETGARQPYRCTVRENGISPGCKFFFIFHIKFKKQLLLFISCEEHIVTQRIKLLKCTNSIVC